MTDYLKINDDNIVITLRSGIEIDGALVKSLTMREPTVQDQLAGETVKGTDGEREIFIFANLCGVAPDDIKKLSLRDYKRVQTAFTNFID